LINPPGDLGGLETKTLRAKRDFVCYPIRNETFYRILCEQRYAVRSDEPRRHHGRINPQHRNIAGEPSARELRHEPEQEAK